MDSGAHRILISQAWRTYVPRSALQSSAFCTMGCALPLATGAKLADPGRVVVAFMGDGGLEMVLGELITLRDLGLPVIVIVFVDASLALIEKNKERCNIRMWASIWKKPISKVSHWLRAAKGLLSKQERN